MAHAVITGVPRSATQSTPPPRREINDLVKDNMQFSLFIQALQAMYKTSQQDGLSHYQIGGIHGLPYQAWETSGSSQVGGWGGYCTHGSVLFPTWHRPYVATYEQVLQSQAVKIAATYTTPDKAQWQNAAQNLRLPYWDWASNAVPPHQVISDVTVLITNASGQQASVPNPLLAYRFNPLDPKFPRPYSSWPATLRHPTSGSSSATSNPKGLISDLQSDATDIRTKTYNLLTRVTTWPAFSNHTPGDGGSSSSSLEAIHDGIHVDVGGGGHMSDPAVAAFDPIFFLHHCNVDRILALWSALNPNVWVTSGSSNGGTWTISNSATETTSSDLTPFWNGATTYWNSTACRDFEKSLNYTYPEFAGLSGQNAATIKAKIGTIVNQLYGSGTSRALATSVTTATTPAAAVLNAAGVITGAAQLHQEAISSPLANLRMAAAPAAIHAPASGSTSTQQVMVQVSGDGKSSILEWSARIHAKKFELGGSYSVLIFIGSVPSDPEQWRSAPSYVGAQHVFANSQMGDCENCRNNQDESVEGFVQLNDAIAAKSGLKSFDASVVEPYLKQELQWRVQKASIVDLYLGFQLTGFSLRKADRSTVDLSQLPSLQVVVVATPLNFQHGDMFPRTGTPVHHHTITEGRPGGHRSA